MQELDIARLPLTGLRLIEASAGTGKTYTIAALYLRLVLDGAAELGRDLDLREILVVTFTEAATEELRDRIRGRLRAAARAFEVGAADGDDPVLEALLAQRDDHTACAERLREMLTRVDEAPIHTIHGFCHRALRENAFDSGAPFRAELVTDETHLQEAIVEDFWRRRFYARPEPYARWVRSRWRTPRDLLGELRGELNHPTLAILPEPDGAAREHLEQAFTAAAGEAAGQWHRAAGEALERIGEAVAAKRLSAAKDKGYAAERLATLRPGWEEWFAAPHLPLPAGFELLTNERLEESVLARAAKAGEGPPVHPLFDACSRVRELGDSLDRHRRIEVLHDGLLALREGLAARKREEQLLSFNDLLTTLADALDGPGGATLAPRLARRHPVALIDEFQDTDPAQYRIFQAVYQGRPGTGLFMIGDPKQAIYSFRGADIFTYMQARRATDAETGRFTLPRNFRSTERLVQAVDALFRAPQRPFVFEEIELPRVRAAGRADQRPLSIDGTAADGLQVWFQPRGEKEKTIAKGRAAERLAGACAGEIAGLLRRAADGAARLGERPLQAQDIAVLVRSHHQAEAVKQALAARGIAAVHQSRQSVFASREAEDLGHILRAVAEPGDDRLLRAALCTPLMGLSAAGLYREMQAGRPWEHRIERFAGYRERWEQRGVLPMLHTLLHEEGVIARVFAAPEAERRMTNLLHLGELLQQAATERYGITGVLRWLQEHIDDPDGAGEVAELRLESDAELVHIVTIHKSKGLQYPVVFLPFLALTRGAEKNPERARFHDDAGALCLDLGSEALDTHVARQRREDLAEEVRLLYVALTRASHRCYLAWGHYTDAERSGLGYLLFPGEDPDTGTPLGEFPETDAALRAPWDHLSEAHPGAITVTEVPAPNGAGAGESRPAERRGRALALTGTVRQDWRLSSYTGLLASHAGQLIEQPDHDAMEDATAIPSEPPAGGGIFGFPRGARAGTFLHRVLELAVFTEPSSLAPLVRHLLPAYGFDGGWAETITAHLEGVLATPLDDAGIRLADLGGGQRIDELAFYFPADDVAAADLDAALPPVGDTRRPPLTFGRMRGMLKGYIDLLFEHQGRYYVVDYKSNHLGNTTTAYAPQRLEQAIAASRYDLQYMLYTLAVHRLLRARLPDYDYDRHFGGVRYLFLRGMSPASGPGAGIHRVRPERAVVEALDALFGGAEATA